MYYLSFDFLSFGAIAFPKNSSTGAKTMETTKTQQDSTMNTEPQQEHQWLQKLVGEWTYEIEVKMGADRPVERSTGTESVRSRSQTLGFG